MREVHRRWWTLVLFTAAIAAGCGDNYAGPGIDAPKIDAPPPDVPPDANPLETLAGTGLCADAACMQINAGILEYEPRFQLWDDTAAKRRWIYLPPGAKIDTSNMDYWVFPVGTKVWKQFTRDTTRVETRMIMKMLDDDTAPGAWFYAAYQWNAAQNATTLVTDRVANANGTQHDIPSRRDCRNGCHERLSSRVLGFDAIQLDYTASAGLTDLSDLVAANLLSVPPSGAAPYFPLPGTAVDAAALGYLHGNCGQCHNPTSDVSMADINFDLRLRPSMLGSVQTTPTYATTVNADAKIQYEENGTTLTKLIVPGMPAQSAVIGRMNSMISIRSMPPIAVETVDPDGQAALTAWISSL
jgi:hypothetical protein